MVKQLSLKQAALSLAAAAALGTSGYVCAQGVDSLESKLYPNYVTDDMLLNADKDASNWLLYGRDYQTTRYSPLKQVNRENIGKLRPVWNLSFGVLEGQDSQAVVVNGTVYVTTSFNKVIAADGNTARSCGSTTASCRATYFRSCAATWSIAA
jgi:alcohol dehydrogenase (cytochrome c)